MFADTLNFGGLLYMIGAMPLWFNQQMTPGTFWALMFGSFVLYPLSHLLCLPGMPACQQRQAGLSLSVVPATAVAILPLIPLAIALAWR